MTKSSRWSMTVIERLSGIASVLSVSLSNCLFDDNMR